MLIRLAADHTHVTLATNCKDLVPANVGLVMHARGKLDCMHGRVNISAHTKSYINVKMS